MSTNTNLVLFIQPDTGRTPLLSAIDNAQNEIDIEVYLLSDRELISHLISAKQKGISVNILLEQHPFGGSNTKVYQELSDSGINVSWANPSFALTHEKSIVIDKKIAFILSQNLSASSFTKNREYDIEDTDPQDVLEVENIFHSDWDRKSFFPTDPHLLISPVSSRNALSQLLGLPVNMLQIEMEVIDDKSITNELCETAQKEKVEIILPTLSQMASNQQAISDLQNCNVAIKALSSPYIHAKMILAGTTAYIGSVNLTTQSMDENRELGITITQPDIISTLSNTFQTDWNKATSVN